MKKTTYTITKKGYANNRDTAKKIYGILSIDNDLSLWNFDEAEIYGTNPVKAKVTLTVTIEPIK